MLFYWTTSNLWTMGQQFYVIRNNPAPGTPAAKAKQDRDAEKRKRKGLPDPATPIDAPDTPENTAPETPKRQQPKKQTRSKRKKLPPAGGKPLTPGADPASDDGDEEPGRNSA